MTLAGSFHFDDYALFSDPAITLARGWYEVWRPLQTRPLTYFTFWANYQIAGANAAPYHAVNIALHAAAALLLFIVLTELLPRNVALIGALLFAVHPAATEPVAYVFARGTLLATTLCLAAFLFWLRERPFAAFLCFAAALLAKEECAALPIFLIAFERSRGRLSQKWTPIAVMIGAALFAGLRVIYATSVLKGTGAGVQAGIGPFDYLSLQGVAILRYLMLLIFPWGYSIDPEINAAGVWRVAAWVLVLASAAVASRWYSGLRAGFWFIAGLILLAPSSSLFPAADIAADRRLYLPMTAFAACAALLISRWRPVVIAAMIAGLAAISIRYGLIWNTERTLWSEAVSRAPGKVRPRIQLARTLPPPEALPLLVTAQTIAPDDPGVASEQGRVLLELGRPAEALAAFGRALARLPGDANAINNRGAALLALGQLDAARRDFERALEVNPCLSNARLNLEHLGATPPPRTCP